MSIKVKKPRQSCGCFCCGSSKVQYCNLAASRAVELRLVKITAAS